MGGRKMFKNVQSDQNTIRRNSEKSLKLWASPPSSRRWKCKRCCHTWRSELSRNCPLCHGPQEEIK